MSSIPADYILILIQIQSAGTLDTVWLKTLPNCCKCYKWTIEEEISGYFGSKIWNESWTDGSTERRTWCESNFGATDFSAWLSIINDIGYCYQEYLNDIGCWLLFELSGYLARYLFQPSGLFFVINNAIFKCKFVINFCDQWFPLTPRVACVINQQLIFNICLDLFGNMKIWACLDASSDPSTNRSTTFELAQLQTFQLSFSWFC